MNTPTKSDRDLAVEILRGGFFLDEAPAIARIAQLVADARASDRAKIADLENQLDAIPRD